MIIREIWCNALDEGGEKREVVDGIGFKKEDAGRTCFFIQATPKMLEVWNSWSDYFIDGGGAIWENEEYGVYPNSDDVLRIYKNGVRIKEEKRGKAVLFRYDLKTADINEMREYCGIWEWDLNEVFLRFDKETAEYYLDNVSRKGLYEGDVVTLRLRYAPHKKIPEAWGEAIGGAKIIGARTIKVLRDAGRIEEEMVGSYLVLPERLCDELSLEFEGVSALSVKKGLNKFFKTEDEDLFFRIRNVIEWLGGMGYVVSSDLSVKTGMFFDQRIIAEVSRDEREIRFSMNVKEMNDFDVAKVVIEENEHYVAGVNDCTREMQNRLLDLFLNVLINKEG